MRLLRLTKSRKKCPLLQLGWGSFPGGLCFKSPVKGPAAKPLSPPRRAVARRAVPAAPRHALVQVLGAEEEPPELRSSCHFSRLRRRAFMKKLLTVVSSRPSCWEMVICISLEGRLFSLKMAKSVLRWRSVKTRRDFFWELFRSLFGSCSLRLQAGEGVGSDREKPSVRTRTAARRPRRPRAAAGASGHPPAGPAGPGHGAAGRAGTGAGTRDPRAHGGIPGGLRWCSRSHAKDLCLFRNEVGRAPDR